MPEPSLVDLLLFPTAQNGSRKENSFAMETGREQSIGHERSEFLFPSEAERRGKP